MIPAHLVPDGFEVNDSGVWFHDAKGRMFEVTWQPLWLAEILQSAETGTQYLRIEWYRHGAVGVATFPFSVVVGEAGIQRLRIFFCNHNIDSMSAAQARRMCKYLRDSTMPYLLRNRVRVVPENEIRIGRESRQPAAIFPC